MRRRQSFAESKKKYSNVFIYLKYLSNALIKSAFMTLEYEFLHFLTFKFKYAIMHSTHDLR